MTARHTRSGCIVASAVAMLFAGLCVYLYLMRPASRVMAAKSWTPTPCRVVSSKVTVVRRSDSVRDLYKVDITYRYSFGGREYTSNQYDLMGDAGSGGVKGKERTVARYPPGRAATCYVNPANPREAVLDRGLPARTMWGIIPLFFLVISILGLGVSIFMLE